MTSLAFIAALVLLFSTATDPDSQRGGRGRSGPRRKSRAANSEFKKQLKKAKLRYPDAPKRFPPVKAFERTKKVPYWSEERDARLLDGLMSPEVAQTEWMGSKKLMMQRVAYFKAYEEKKHEGVPLIFNVEDKGREVAFTERTDGTFIDGDARVVHVLKRAGAKEDLVRTVESVVPEVGGEVVFDDGTVIENGLREHRKTPYFKYVDKQTVKRPRWEKRDEERFEDVAKGKETYRQFKTDPEKTKKKSTYTQRFRSRFPDLDSYDLQSLSKHTGVPEPILQQVYDKGMAAWKTGHRPGARQHAWAQARVYSFLVLGCTVFANDDALARDAALDMTDEQLQEWTGQEIACPSYKLKRKYFQKAVSRLRGSRFLDALCSSELNRDNKHACAASS